MWQTSHCYFFSVIDFSLQYSNIDVVHEFHLLFLRSFKNWCSSLIFGSGGKEVFALVYRRWWIDCLKILFELRENLLNVIILLIQSDLVAGLSINKKLFLFFHWINYKGCIIKLTFDKSRLDTDKHWILAFCLIIYKKC